MVGDPSTNAGVAPVDATSGLKVDLGADNDITGTVTANLSATDNAVLDAIEADTTIIASAVSGTEMQVDILTSALPTGAATSAKQDTIIGHVDGIEGLLTTIDGDTGTIAGAVSGAEMQVDVVGSLPAGTNAIGKLAANSGVDIGDVDITSVIPGTGATNLGKAIDTATGATDTGVLALATRDDALSTLTPIEGDNVQLRTDSTGALWTKISGTVTVDGSGVTQPISHAGLTELAAAINTNKLDVNIVSSDVATGGTSAADDADFTATTTTGTPAMGVYESTPTSVTDGDMGIVGITTGRRLKTSATIDTALPAGTNAIGKLSANSGVDIGDVDVTSISAGDNTIGRVKLTDGTTVATVRELGTNDALNVAMVDGSGNQVTSFGGGTQYTEADTDASITGTAVMWEDTGDTLRAVSAAKPLPIGDAGGSLTIDGTVAVSGTVAVTQSGTWDEVGINDSGNSITIDYNGSAISTANAVPIQPPAAGYLAVNETGGALTALQLIDDTVYTDGSGTPSKAIGVAGTDGTNPQIIKTDTNGELQVDILSIAAGDNNIGNMDVASIAAGDNNIGNVDIVSGTVTTVTTLTGGGIAHDSADSGNPHKMGAKAFSPDGTTPGTAVAENDRTDLKADLDGRLFVNTEHPRMLHKHLDGTSAYTDESLVADPGDGFQIIIKSIIFSSGEAVAINFFLEEGATKIFGPIYIEAVAGRGFVSGPINLPVTPSTAVTLTTSAANDQSFDMDYIIQAV